MLVDIAQHRVVFDEGDDGIAGRHRRIAGVDRIRERSGVAEIMPARHRRSVGHGEGRKQRMRILEVDALVADLGHRRRGLRVDDLAAQAIGDKEDEIAGRGVLRRGSACGQCDQACRKQHDCAAHQILSVSGKFGREPLPCLVLLCDSNVTANFDRGGDKSPWSRGAPGLRKGSATADFRARQVACCCFPAPRLQAAIQDGRAFAVWGGIGPAMARAISAPKRKI